MHLELTVFCRQFGKSGWRVAVYFTFKPTLIKNEFIRQLLLDELAALERDVTGAVSYTLCVLHPEWFRFRRV